MEGARESDAPFFGAFFLIGARAVMDADAEKTRDDAGAMGETTRIVDDDDSRASAVARAKHAGNHANGARRDDAARAREENPVGDVSVRAEVEATLDKRFKSGAAAAPVKAPAPVAAAPVPVAGAP